MQLIQKADRLCPASAADTWAALVTTLAELDRYTEARALAAQIEEAANAPAQVKAAAVSARETCDKRDKAFPDTDEAKATMRVLYAEGITAREKPDAASQRLAKEKYMAAWEAWRPNGEALVGAGFARRRLGQSAEAQRLFDRALVDGEKTQGKEVMLDVPNGFSAAVRSIA